MIFLRIINCSAILQSIAYNSIKNNKKCETEKCTKFCSSRNFLEIKKNVT